MPKAPEVEQAVLGAVFRDKGALYEVIDLLSTDAFCHPVYRHIWQAMRDLASQDQPIDVLTVAGRLEESRVLDVCGGRAALVEIVESVSTAASVRSHANILLDYQKRRALWSLCHDTLRELDAEPSDVVAKAEGRMLEIAEIGRGPTSTTDEQIERMITTDLEIVGGKLPGHNWPIPELSRATRGIRPGRIYLIIALYKTGKSKLTVAAIHQLIAQDKVPVLFLSLEMGASQVFHWLAGHALKIDTALYDSVGLSEQQMNDSHQWVMQNVADGLLTVNDRALQTPEAIASAMRHAAISRGVKVVFIDYLQKIAWGEGRSTVTDIARGMNLIAATAKRLNITVVALSQVPKSVERQPAEQLINIGDVKDAAAFAETADVSISITDPERHREGRRPQRDLKFLVEQRDGPTRVLDIRADLRYGCFHSLTTDAQS